MKFVLSLVTTVAFTTAVLAENKVMTEAEIKKQVTISSQDVVPSIPPDAIIAFFTLLTIAVGLSGGGGETRTFTRALKVMPAT